jgi:hypothetical protein
MQLELHETRRHLHDDVLVLRRNNDAGVGSDAGAQDREEAFLFCRRLLTSCSYLPSPEGPASAVAA